ncbi:DEAD/DEAH box helicase [Lipingzhangella sp. LS1_29]|uniref:DEAD/DEAH box helicase n=1 Tax=Lipingzhangella rawalii TaxID=2055835 RepID=A0ABU2H0W7_9ACTN|nr:DEAD/DEAH box helicase [Lipingzhangella rawalii]MDS1268951.1 DEAD/DEAH box helicase [Lipingzhangella rawalii]
MSSHAARHAASRERHTTTGSVISDFESGYSFGFDRFQLRACQALERGHGVLVAAPTGSGKTVVGEFAVHLALHEGRKCFYTTPIKALSNQKYADLQQRYGADNVGLLTGDNSINGDAPIVVMTTEVLRNMLYAGSGTLSRLSYVVLDEVHYLADRFRGAVWEEVIIHLPASVRMVALSATVSNAEEFGEWLQQVRGDTTVIVDERRPVPLWQHVMVGKRIRDLFVPVEDSSAQAPGQGSAGQDGAGDGHRRSRRRDRRRRSDNGDQLGEVLVNGAQMRLNPELVRLAQEDERETQLAHRRRHPRARGGRPRPRTRFAPPRRVDVLTELDRAALLPAITFIFSRAGCDAAVRECLRSGLTLTTADEEDEIREVAEERCADMSDQDLAALGYDEWLAALQRGVAAHHAGMLPTFKEVVEILFTRGLIRAVFATETLALGINMPARTVVIEKLDKWNGETHADLTPGEYTQLTGRAGRRGIDVEGHAVVLWQPGIDPERLAGLASTRTYPLNSSFQPSYNMAVNLVGQVGRERSRTMLEASFAQFQADRSVVGLVRQLRKQEEALAGYAEAAQCHLGDFMGYARLRRELSDVESRQAKQRGHQRRQEAVRSLHRLRVGDVIRVPAGRRPGYAVVLDPGLAFGGDPAPLVLTARGQVRRLGPGDFPAPVEAEDRMRIPKHFAARSPRARRDLASTLRNRLAGLPRDEGGDAAAAPDDAADTTAGVSTEVEELRTRIRHHPCHDCADREDHARWAERYLRLERETEGLRRKVASRTHVIARTFDRVCAVLEQLGYLAPAPEVEPAANGSGEEQPDQRPRDAVTPAGRKLAKIYSELDLLAAECLRQGVWDDLVPDELAACVSALVYESRRNDDPEPRIPAGATEAALTEMGRLWGELHRVERDHDLSFLRQPDPGFAWIAYRWAQGAALEAVLEDADMPAGDFVRATKMLVDMLGQIADAAGEESPVRRSARAAVGALHRGVVAYSSVG